MSTCSTPPWTQAVSTCVRVTRDGKVFASRCAGVYFSPSEVFPFKFAEGVFGKFSLIHRQVPLESQFPCHKKRKPDRRVSFLFYCPGCQESHYPVIFLSLSLSLISFSSVLLSVLSSPLSILSVSFLYVFWRIGGTSEKYLMHSRWNTVMTVLDKHFALITSSLSSSNSRRNHLPLLLAAVPATVFGGTLP